MDVTLFSLLKNKHYICTVSSRTRKLKKATLAFLGVEIGQASQPLCSLAVLTIGWLFLFSL